MSADPFVGRPEDSEADQTGRAQAPCISSGDGSLIHAATESFEATRRAWVNRSGFGLWDGWCRTPRERSRIRRCSFAAAQDVRFGVRLMRSQSSTLQRSPGPLPRTAERGQVPLARPLADALPLPVLPRMSACPQLSDPDLSSLLGALELFASRRITVQPNYDNGTNRDQTRYNQER